jgi:hypothetical protein
LDAQQRLAQKVNHRKRERNLDAIDESLVERIREHSGDKISAIMEDPSYGKVSRLLPTSYGCFCLLMVAAVCLWLILTIYG